MMMKKFLFISLTFALVLVCSGQNRAESAINLRINNPKVELSVRPGESKSGQITIENPTEQSLSIKCYLEDWFYTSEGDGSKDFRPASTTPLSCASWINFTPAEFVLNPYGREVLSYRVNVPPEASGGYYAVLFFETAIGEGRDEQGLTILILGRLGSLFYVDAEGTINKQARLTNITVKEEEEGFKVTALFKNTGNVYIACSGNFNLIDRNGVVFARGQFNDTYTFPETEVSLQATWEKDIEPGIYDLIITLDLGEKTLVEERQVRLGGRKPEFLE